MSNDINYLKGRSITNMWKYVIGILSFCILSLTACTTKSKEQSKVQAVAPTDTEAAVAMIDSDTVVEDISEESIPIDNSSDYWSLHKSGGFKYPSSYNHQETFIEDAPGSVEVFSKGDIELCYWCLLGAWSTTNDFPDEGVWLSATEQVRNVTYRAESKGIVSGYTQNGNIYYLKRKIMYGGEVNHSKVLVLINPPSENDKVIELRNIVKNW